ncbi:MAG: hypothetical protein FWG29_02440 [Treponema sp.]|nr:hypothetical protein [Treponema sp.]
MNRALLPEAATIRKMTIVLSNRKTAPLSASGYDRLEGLEEQVLLSAVYQPLIPLLNFFMPTQKLKSKTRVGSKEFQVYDEPRSPFQRLMEPTELHQQTKDSLITQIALYNPVQLQHNVNKAILRLRQRLAQTNRVKTGG